MEILAYSFQRAGNSFVLKLRPSRKWRVKVSGDYLDELFESAEQAVAKLSCAHPVPRTLDEWVPSKY